MVNIDIDVNEPMCIHTHDPLFNVNPTAEGYLWQQIPILGFNII
jgi:hypothetical protein